MRFHVLAVPHTVTSKEFVACAFTQKVLKFASMMHRRGHEVIHYGHEESQVECTEHVTVLSSAAWRKCYGDYDWRTTQFKYDTNDLAYRCFTANAVHEIGLRKQSGDFLLPFWGSPMKAICDAHPDLLTVEPGIGYPGGHFAPYKVFESYAMLSAYYGLASVANCPPSPWYDVVIPNYFDPDDFETERLHPKGGDFLFLGRVYEGKGVHIAVEVTKAIGAKLVVAGQGSLEAMGYSPEQLSHVVQAGYADSKTRKELLRNARALFVPSLYTEPFAGVQVEAFLSGTPVISTDWGALAEYNLHGVTGYRCRTFEQFCWAARNIGNINPADCRTWGENFTFDKVAPMYEEFFQSVANIYGGKGWYEPNESRTELEWLRKVYP